MNEVDAEHDLATPAFIQSKAGGGFIQSTRSRRKRKMTNLVRSRKSKGGVGNSRLLRLAKGHVQNLERLLSKLNLN